MRCHSFISSVVALSLSLPAYSLSHVADDPRTLLPINIRDFEAAAGIQRRASENFSDLDPATQARLIYGQPGENGQLLLADMTLHASDGLDIVMMEKFEGLTTKVDCKGDDGSMSLTFKSKEAFDQAMKKWNFINKAEEEKFLLIANHDGCGPDDERQPYLITNIREDESTLTTFLTAQPVSWSEIASDFDIDFGKVVTKPVSHRRVKNRSLVQKVAHKVTSSIENKINADIPISKAFDITVSQPGVRTNIIDNEKKHLKIDCINCFIAGKFKVTGHLKVEKSKITQFVMESSPEDVKAELELEATISASTELFSEQITKDLLKNVPIPDAGIKVVGILTLGAFVSYSVGVNASFSGQGVVDFGLTASLPNSAKVTADIINEGGNSAVGFNEVTFKPLFDVKSLSATVELVAFSEAKIAFGIKVTDIGTLDVAVTLQIPKVTTTLTAAFDEQGVCSTDPGSSKTGIKLESKIALEVDLDLDATHGADKSPTKSFPLFTDSKELFSTCFPIDIPGLKPVSPTSSLPVGSIAPPTLTLNPSLPLPADPTTSHRNSLNSSSIAIDGTGKNQIFASFATATVTGVPIPLSTGVVGGRLPTLQPSGGPVPSGLMPRGSFRGLYYPVKM